MGSTIRNDTSKALFLERIAKAWDKVPNLSFGELISKAMEEDTGWLDTPMSDYSNKQIAEAIERYVLLKA